MKYDRQIIISTGNSRRDLIWKQTTLTVSELWKQNDLHPSLTGET